MVLGCYFSGNELYVKNMHVAEYHWAGGWNRQDPKRDRKLLLNRKELDKLQTTYYNNRNMNEKAYADLLKQQEQILSRSKNPSALTPRLTDTQDDRDRAKLNTYKQAYDQIISKQQEMLRTGEYLNSMTVEKLTKEANAYANAYNELANLMRGKGMQVDHLKTTPFETYSANGGYYTVDYYNENTARANANRARENQKDY